MADKRERVTATVELEDELSRPARQAASSVDELSDEVDELSVSAAAATTQTNRLERALAALRRASGSATREVDKSDTAMKRWAIAQRAAGKEGSALGKVWERTGKQAMKFFGILRKLLILPAITGLIVAAAGALSALGAAGFAAIAGLSPLVGTLGAMPALLLGLGAAVASVKLGFKGIGDAAKVALDASKTTSEIEDALRGLTPEGREFVGVLGQMKDETDGWGRSIQAAMLPQFSDALRSLAPVLPVVEKGLTRAGGAMGYLALEVGRLVGSRGNSLELIFANSERMITNGLTPAVRGATSALLDLAVAGGPLAQRFAEWIGRSADNLARMTAEGRRTGELRSFLNRAGELASEVAETIGNIAVALYNTGKQSDALSSSMGRGFSGMIADWRAWTESVEGQESIRKYFEDAGPAIAEVTRMLKLLGQGFLNMASNSGVANTLKQINDELIPAMGDFASTVSNSIVPALVNFASAFFEAYALINTTPIPEVLMSLSEGAMALADGLNALPGPIKTVIVSLIALKAISKLGGSAMGAFATSMVPVRQRLGDVRAGVQLYTEGVSGIRRPTAAAQGAMAGLAGAGKGLFAAMGGPWGVALAGAAVAFGVYASKQAESKARVQELTATLDEQTGAFTENTDAAVARMLVDKGWDSKKLEEYGLTLADVTAATIEGGDALTALRTQVENDFNFDPTFRKSLDFLELSGGDALSADLKDISGEIAVAKSTTEDLAEARAEAARKSIGHTQAMSVEEMQARGLMDTTGATADALRDWGNQTQFVITKTKALNDLLIQNGRSYLAFRQSVIDSRKTLFEGELTLDDHTQAGIDNKNAMYDLVEAANGVTNAAKRQKALREAEAIIRDWGRQAGFSKGKIDDLVESMITTQERVKALDGSKVNIYFTANGLNQIITDADRAQTKIMDLVASQGQVRVQQRGTVTTGRRREHGGPVVGGLQYTVGEAGPELFVGPSGVEVIGAAGQEQRTFPTTGVVLPNEYYEAAVVLPSVDRAPEPARSGVGGGAEPVPEIHNHFHGDGSQLTEADIERASLSAYRKFDRERRERR